MQTKFVPELELILLVIRDKPNEDKLMVLIAQVRWDYLLQLIVRHRLVGPLYSALQNISLVPASFLAQLKQLNQQMKINSLRLSAEAIRIARVFERENVPFIIVKGIPLAVNLYGGSDKRQCKDVDIWVSTSDLERAENLLHKLGYITMRPAYKLVGLKKKFYLNHAHEIALVNSSRLVEVELHFKLESVGTNFFSFDKVRTQSLFMNRQKFITLEDNYNFLYLMLHGAKHGWSRLRWLNDIALYIRQDKCDLDLVYSLSCDLKCEHLFMQSLWLLRDFYQISNEKIDQLLTHIDARALKLADFAKQFICADFVFIGDGYVFKSMFLKYRYYQITLDNGLKRFSAVWDILFNLDRVFSLVNLPRYCGFVYYILYPFEVIRHFIMRIFRK